MTQNNVYFGDFNSREGVEEDFNVTLDDDITILFANYTNKYYEGDAFVLFEQAGVLYEVNGSHCCCYGLEDQWIPEEVLLAELYRRYREDEWGFSNERFGADARVRLGELLDSLVAAQEV